MGLLLLQAPADPLVSVEGAQAHLRADDPTEVDLIGALVDAATGQAEAYLWGVTKLLPLSVRSQG